jgi:hypothetical protein
LRSSSVMAMESSLKASSRFFPMSYRFVEPILGCLREPECPDANADAFNDD